MSKKTEERFFVGLDVGQSQDYTALTVIQQIGRKPAANEKDRGGNPYPEPEYHLRYISRFPLGTSYRDVSKRVAEILTNPDLRGSQNESYPKGRPPELIVDKTGVGAGVVEMLKSEGIKPISVTITGGSEPAGEHREYRVPKRDLATTGQIVLQDGRIKIPAGLPLSDILVRELQNFKAKININGHASFEHHREGDHDDIVLSLCLALWYAERPVRQVWLIL